MLTTPEAARYCGFKSVNGFGRWVRVAPVKIGNKVLYDVRALDRWLDRLSHSESGGDEDWLGRLDEDQREGA